MCQGWDKAREAERLLSLLTTTMADLTVLSPAPSPLYPLASASRSSIFSNYVPGASTSKVNLVPPSPMKRERPGRIQVGEREERGEDEEDSQSEEQTVADSPDSYLSPQATGGWNRGGDSWRLDSNPNLATVPRGRPRIQAHRPTRSRSAPPTQITFQVPMSSKPFTAASDQSTFDLARLRRFTSTSSYTSGTDSGPSSPSSSFSASSPYGYGKNGDLLKPPPPLHRPTTFWRHTPRSGVTASSYSPSSHLVRRSTFVAAGLPFDRPMADLSALGVESRVRAQFDEDNARAKVSEVFWEVVVQR
jgi:hypothetical protein